VKYVGCLSELNSPTQLVELVCNYEGISKVIIAIFILCIKLSNIL
jgi:hypothetical protein